MKQKKPTFLSALPGLPNEHGTFLIGNIQPLVGPWNGSHSFKQNVATRPIDSSYFYEGC